MRFERESLGIPISITKDLKDYHNEIHAKAARLANQKFNLNILKGDKIKYIFVLGDDRVIAYKDKIPVEYEIDYDNVIRRIVDLKVQPL
jgi:DNA polymerase elongation subunit (family B)